jgi:putative copper resistance protein D
MPGMRMAVPRPVTLADVLTAWQWGLFPVAMVIASVAAAAWYVNATRAASGRDGPWPPSRTASFLGGLIAIDIALQSPVATYTMWYFQAHIVQHLLLMVIAPPLLAIGAPLQLVLAGRRSPNRDDLPRWLDNRAVRVALHPLPVWFLYYFSMFAFFLTSALNYAMLHMWLMDLVNLGFLLTAALFWWPLVGLDPLPRRPMSSGAKVANILIGVPVELFLALALINDHRPAASMYTMSSTRSGALLLCIAAQAFNLVSLIPVSVRWWRSDERRAARRYDLTHPVEVRSVTSHPGRIESH